MAPTRLEKLEKLEQLRALENGLKIKVFLTNYNAIGVDVPSDVKKVESLLAKRRRAR
jgi:3-deoxy-manno-octulosonate cytidylyltransferase (CMP-KDO synthetase)